MPVQPNSVVSYLFFSQGFHDHHRAVSVGLLVLDAAHLVFVAADGRSSGYSKGVTMTEFAQIFAGLGAQVAYNLDGGGSTTMVFNDTLVNNPLGKGQERGTSDIIYIAG